MDFGNMTCNPKKGCVMSVLLTPISVPLFLLP